MKVLIALAMLFGFSMGVAGNASAGTLTFFCKFPTYATLDGLEKAKDFSIKFIVDTITEKAVMVGNNGFSDMIMISGDYGITFLEILNTGAVQSTTVSMKTGQAVHSRHSMIGADELLPSQYYGNCKIAQ